MGSLPVLRTLFAASPEIAPHVQMAIDNFENEERTPNQAAAEEEEKKKEVFGQETVARQSPPAE